MARCTLVGGKHRPRLEMPLWMLDRAACANLNLEARPRVDGPAYQALHQLIVAAISELDHRAELPEHPLAPGQGDAHAQTPDTHAPEDVSEPGQPVSGSNRTAGVARTARAPSAAPGVEAVQVRLDDVEWRAGKIHVRARKGGRHSVYPLTPTVANALIAYLKDGRPESSHREIFLTQYAPFRPMQTVAVRHVVKKYLKAAGCDAQGVGAHTLRYSCAQRLFESDFSIKVIGDYLGHRHLGTTQRYIKIDLKNLRSVAINDGEAML